VTITLGTRAQLLNRVHVQVPVTGTCTPPSDAAPTTASLSVTLQQAFAKAVATEVGFTTVPCDGSQFSVNVDVMPQGTVAFHNGSAVTQASVAANFNDGTSISVTNGPLAIRITS
jgi:hypothetical protein